MYMFDLNNGITHSLLVMWCPISNYCCAMVIAYLTNFTGCVLDIAGFFLRLSTQDKVAVR